MKKRLKRYFVTGLLVLVPLFVSLKILMLIVDFMDSLMRFLPPQLRPENHLPYDIPGIGVVITLVVIVIIGFLTTNFLGKSIVRLYEAMLIRIPILKTVYKASKQFVQTFFAEDNDGFSKVVLIEFPRKGLYAIGFVTCRTRGEVQKLTPEDTINIFIPTTPNPTSGFYFAVPKTDVMPLKMTVEDAFKVIMSGGMVVPESFEADKNGFDEPK